MTPLCMLTHRARVTVTWSAIVSTSHATSHACARTAKAGAKNAITNELPHAAVLQHNYVLQRTMLGKDVVQTLFAAHCELDSACGRAMSTDTPVAATVTMIVGAVLRDLALSGWRGSSDQATVLHRVTTACMKGDLTESLAVGLAATVGSVAPEQVQLRDVHGRLPLDIALQCTGCFALQRELSPLLFNRYQPTFPFIPLHRSTTSVVLCCRDFGNDARGGTRSIGGGGSLGRGGAHATRDSGTIMPPPQVNPQVKPFVAVKIMTSADQWRRELEARRWGYDGEDVGDGGTGARTPNAASATTPVPMSGWSSERTGSSQSAILPILSVAAITNGGGGDGGDVQGSYPMGKAGEAGEAEANPLAPSIPSSDDDDGRSSGDDNESTSTTTTFTQPDEEWRDLTMWCPVDVHRPALIEHQQWHHWHQMQELMQRCVI